MALTMRKLGYGMLTPDGSNVFAYYDPKANERLRDGDEAFEKRKIWCK
jgi:hypothetical protein